MRREVHCDNAIVFDSKRYKTEEEFLMDVARTLKTLTKQNYMCAFRYEDVGIYVLGFDYDNPEYGSPRIYWLDDEQLECLYTSNHIEEDDEEGCCCCNA